MTAAETANNYKLSSRPKEGDLIWFPLSDTIFEIKYVGTEKKLLSVKRKLCL